MRDATRLLVLLLLLSVIALEATAQPQIAYIIPDIGVEGMNTYVEIIAPVTAIGTFLPSTGDETIYSPQTISIKFLNPLDSDRVVVSPCVVSWEGRLISCQFFVKPGAPTGAIPFRVVVDGRESNVDTFFIVQAQTFGVKSGGGVIGSGGGWGRRSKRGAMIVDSLVLRGGVYSIDVATDPDPSTPGQQGFLPAIILSKGPIRIESGAVLDASASGKNGGPGGGGGGGYGSGGRILGTFPIPGEQNTPLGFGYAGGKSNVTAAPSPATSFGEGTGASSRSLNGVEASNGFSPGFPTIRGYAAAPGHPFDRDGRSGGASAIVVNTTTISFGQYYGGGGNAQKGQSSFPSTEDYLNGQIVGNRQGVPLHGGGGGSSGGPQDSVGAGGGGGLAIYSQLGAALLGIRANGASGANGCANCGAASGNAAAGGAGGSILVGGKLGLTIGNVQVQGGSPGTSAAPATSTGTESGSGGAGRFRHDGKTVGAPTVTTGASRWVGPTVDTLTLVTSPLFDVSGTGLPGADIQVYVRGEDIPWDVSRNYRTAVRPDSTWSVEVGFPSTDSLLYLFAVQTTTDTERDQTDEWTRIPSHVFSQSAANIIRYQPSPNLVAPKDFWTDTILCENPFFNTILVRNTGLAPLEFQSVRIIGSGTSYLTVTRFPLSIPPGGTDSIVVRYTGTTLPGINTANLEIITNDGEPGKSPWITQIHIFNGTKSYLDPDPDSPPTIDFGIVRVNSALRKRAVIHNLNTVVSTNVLVDSLWVKPPTVGIKTISRSIPKDTPIPPGDSLVIEVEYLPTQAEELNGVFLCARIAQPCLDTICWPLLGKAVESTIRTFPDKLEMQAPACPSPNPVFDTLTLTNEGNGTIILLSIEATPKPPFNVVEPSQASFPVLVQGDSSKRVIVSYTPVLGAPPPGLLTIKTNNASLGNIELNINVKQDEAAMRVSTDSISLTSPCPNLLTKTDVLFENTGSVVIDVTPAFASTANRKFGIPLGSFQIPPGSSAQREISFNSTTKGVFYDTLFITAEPCGLRDTIILRGEVTGAEYTVSPDPIFFNNAPVGAVTQLAAQVTNDGATPMRITGAQIIPSTLGISVSAFESFPKDVNPAAQTGISIEFLPTTLGSIPPGTILEIYLDLPCKDTIRVVVGGEAIDADLVIQPGSLDFGGVLYCLAETDTVWAKNTAAGTIGIRSISVDPPNLGFSAILDDPSVPFVPFGDSVAILITFAPTAAPDGLKNALVKVETDNPEVGTIDVPVQGVRQTQSLQMAGGAFGPTFPGGTTQQTFTITNNGTGTVPIINLVVPPPFRVVATRPPLPRSLAPNATMEVDIEFAPTAALTYIDSIFVDAEGLTPCDSLYLPITATGEAVIIGEAFWDDVVGEPGEVIMLPLKLKTNLFGAGVLSYSVDVNFNKTMLLPQRVVLQGTLSQKWNVTSTEVDTGSIVFTVVGSTPLSDTGTLAYVEALVLLGNDITTPLTSSTKSQFTTGGARISVTPGLFTLKGYCSVGGNRLVQVTGNFGIKAVAPNPAQERIAVEFELVEDGMTRLRLYDALGRESYRFVNEDLEARSYRVESELDLPPGVYILELVTPTQREEVRVIVE